jgi:uncharacterized protein YjbI with pentapeptide repeats
MGGWVIMGAVRPRGGGGEKKSRLGKQEGEIVANPEHVAILEKGANFWNVWREEPPHVQPDLSGADIKGERLNGYNLKGANLGRVNFNHAEISDSNLSTANLSRANLNWTFLNEVNLREADLFKADLGWALLRNVDITGARLAYTTFTGFDLDNVIGLDSVVRFTEIVSLLLAPNQCCS